MKPKKLSVVLLNPPYITSIIMDNYCCFTAKSGYSWLPVDLLYLTAVLKNPHIRLTVIDAIASGLSPQKTIDLFKRNPPDIIISLTGTVSFEADLELLKSLKKITGARLLLMGNTPCFEPEYFLSNFRFVDGILHNFFDINLKNYLFDAAHVPRSVSTITKGKFIKGQVNPFPKGETISLGYLPSYDLFPLGRYRTPLMKKSPMVTMLTGFGCPYKCEFCIGSCLDYHPRNMRDLESEFQYLKKIGVKEIFFEDSTFNANKLFLKKICELLIKNKYGFSWSANIHSRTISPDDLILMKKAGCHMVQIGVESGNKATLDRYSPTKDIAVIKAVFKLCQKVGIRTLGYFIIGFPGEDATGALVTIQLAKELDPYFASFSILTPDYGTKLGQKLFEAKKNQKLRCFDSSGKSIINHPHLSPQQQDAYINLAYRQFYFRPGKLLSYLGDTHNFYNYLRNGLLLVRSKILG